MTWGFFTADGWECKLYCDSHDGKVRADLRGARKQLEDLISYIQPKKVFPVHTENQELFKEHCRNVQTIEYGKEYML